MAICWIHFSFWSKILANFAKMKKILIWRLYIWCSGNRRNFCVVVKSFSKTTGRVLLHYHINSCDSRRMIIIIDNYITLWLTDNDYCRSSYWLASNYRPKESLMISPFVPSLAKLNECEGKCSEQELAIRQQKDRRIWTVVDYYDLIWYPFCLLDVSAGWWWSYLSTYPQRRTIISSAHDLWQRCHLRAPNNVMHLEDILHDTWKYSRVRQSQKKQLRMLLGIFNGLLPFALPETAVRWRYLSL